MWDSGATGISLTERVTTITLGDLQVINRPKLVGVKEITLKSLTWERLADSPESVMGSHGRVRLRICVRIMPVLHQRSRSGTAQPQSWPSNRYDADSGEGRRTLSHPLLRVKSTRHS